MLLAIIAMLSVSEAHPIHRPPPVVHVAPPRPDFHWVSSHYDRWGRWIPGHWATAAEFDIMVCRLDREGRMRCDIR
jgi:hypothetical protein